MADRADADTVLLDVDGTLIDSTYHHALAWHRGFAEQDVTIPMWRLHRAIGMGGDRLVKAVAGEEVEERLGDALRDAQKRLYDEVLPEVVPFEAACALIDELHRRGWLVALASSGRREHTQAGAACVFDDVGELLEHLDETPLAGPKGR